MRGSCFLAGLLGAAGLAQAGLGFQTIVDGKVDVKDPAGQTLGFLDSINGLVLGNNGQLAASVLTKLDLSSYSTAPGVLFFPGDAAHSAVRVEPAPSGIFEHLTLSPTAGQPRLTFVWQSDGSRRIYQATLNSPVSNPVAPSAIFPTASSTAALNGIVDERLPLAINASGQLLFGAEDGTTQQLMKNTGSTPTVLASATDDLSGYQFFRPNDGSSDYLAANTPINYALTPGGSAVLVARNPAGARQILDVSSPGAHSVRFQDTTLPGYSPVLTLGATANQTLLRASINNSDTRREVILQYRAPGDGFDQAHYQTFGSYTQTNAPFHATAMLTEQGKVAAMVPADSGGLLEYFDANSGMTQPQIVATTSVTQVLENGAIAGDPLLIDSLATSASTNAAPMLNDQGQMVFAASVHRLSQPSNAIDALLLWTPQSSLPALILKVGDSIDINGSPQTVSALGINFLDYQANPLGDALSDDGRLAIAVSYQDGADQFSAIVMTDLPAVPEPASGALLLVSSTLLLGCRRRKRISK